MSTPSPINPRPPQSTLPTQIGLQIEVRRSFKTDIPSPIQMSCVKRAKTPHGKRPEARSNFQTSSDVMPAIAASRLDIGTQKKGEKS